MTLYHGTNVDFSDIDLTKSRLYKDFGQGFYLTEERYHAERLAQQRCLVDGGKTVVMVFNYDCDLASKDDNLSILTFAGYSREWAEFVNLNRNKDNDGRKNHHYDIVYGPIADDKVGLQVKLYNQQIIDIDTLIERLKYVKPTFQYYFGTEKALRYLTRKHE